MRRGTGWGWWALGVGWVLLLGGCQDPQEVETPGWSVLTFRYDAVRDVVLVATEGPGRGELTAARYAAELAQQPAVQVTVGAARLSAPQATVTDGHLVVDYGEVTGLEGLASAQATAVLAALEAWWWVPGVEAVELRVRGRPLTTLGPVTLGARWRRPLAVYVVQPQTGEVAHLVGGPTPATLAEAVAVLRRREIRRLPATQGFVPVLPPGATLATTALEGDTGVLPVALPADFPRGQSARLAALVLTLTQYPAVHAVRLRMGDEVVRGPVMRGRFDAPLTPYQLLVPAAVARVVSAEEWGMLQAAAPASAAPRGRVWREWAALGEATADAPGLVLQRTAQGYQLLGSPTQAVLAGMPLEALVALRAPGWERLLMAQENEATAGAR
jgi:hypothetical protein